MYRSQVVIARGEGYTLTSYGNGLAYRLANELEGSELFVQGEEAEELRRDFEALESRYPTWTDATTLEFLWARVGYGDAATPIVRVEAPSMRELRHGL